MKIVFLISFILTGFFAIAQKKIIVAQDGTGNFKTVQEAFNSIVHNNKKPVTIFIKNGVYNEKLHLDSSKNFVTLLRKATPLTQEPPGVF